MALTLTSRFNGVSIAFDLGLGDPILSTVQWRLSDDESGTIVGFEFFGRPPISGEPGYDDLVILQTIFASSDGFRDIDGNSVPVIVRRFPYGTTTDSIEEYGYYNPLDASSYDRWLRTRQIQGAFLSHAEVEEDSATGRVDIITRGGTDIRIFTTDAAVAGGRLHGYGASDRCRRHQGERAVGNHGNGAITSET